MTRYGKTAVSTLALTLAAQGALAEGELNALVWCDHTDPALIEPFEEAHDVKVNCANTRAPAPRWRCSTSPAPATGTCW